jgi:hypothetical protein
MSKEIQCILACNIQDNYPDFNIIISDEEPYTLYSANDLAKKLNMTSIRSIIRNYDATEKYKVNSHTNGGNQDLIFITYNGLLKLLTKSRKPNVIDFCKICNIDLTLHKFICIEADTIKCILDAYHGKTMILQYRIDNYIIDLYFPEYKLAIECYENHCDIIGDTEREEFIKNKLDCKFIRYKPYAKDFNIFKVINQINRSIYDL